MSSSSSDDVLRGEVSARIAEVLGSWDMSKTVSRVFSGLSSRVMGALRGQAAPDVQVQRDLTGGLAQRLADQYSRVSGRMLAGGINVVTVSLMVTAFTMTGGLTGVEVGIAGASAALSQTILEAYFGERTVRSLAEQAREALERLAGESLSDVVAPVSASLDRASDKVLIDKLAAAADNAREVLA